MAPQFAERLGCTACPILLDEFGGDAFKHLRRQGEPIDALQFGDAGEEAFKTRFAGVGLQIGQGDGFGGMFRRSSNPRNPGCPALH